MSEQRSTKPYHKALRILTLVIIAVNASLAYFELIAIKHAVLVTIIFECIIGLVFVFFLSQGIRSFRDARKRELSLPESLSLFAAQVLPAIILKLAKHELAMWKLVGLLLRRKTNVPANAKTFHYGADQRAIYITLLIIAIIEIAVAELVIPWRSVRIFALVVSIYGAVWLFLFYKSFSINPHYADEKP